MSTSPEPGSRLAEAGIDLSDVTLLLLEQGIEKFEVPMKELLETVEQKRSAAVGATA